MTNERWARFKKSAKDKGFPVYFILGTQQFPDLDKEGQIDQFLSVLKQACQGGIRYFQFRDKDGSLLTDDERHELAIQAKQVCSQYQVPFIINDDVQLAIDLEADGLHVGQKDLAAAQVRQKIGDKMILGVSAHTTDQVKKAIEDGADYVGCGPIFTTQTKANVRPAIGGQVFKDLQAVNPDFPVFAIGGIHQNNVYQVHLMNPDAICVISEITQADDISLAIKKLSRT